MSAGNFKTTNNTYRQLIGNGLIYRVPRFQRDYSWTDTEWEELWLDMAELLEANTKTKDASAHYMGYLVLQSEDDKTYDVIDGQQRLTTLAVFVLAVLKNVQRLVDRGEATDDNTKRAAQIRATYIGYLDPVTLVSQPKLTLNRNNNDYFNDYMVPLQKLPKRGFRASEHQLRKAFEWFDKRVQAWLTDRKPADVDAGVFLARLVERMSDRLFFTVITVTDELNAYRVFETLNSRGVKLSSTDLLKNYLFSVLDHGQESAHELKSLDDRWSRLVTRLDKEKFPTFLRVHWNSRHRFMRRVDTFKEVRKKVQRRADVFALLRALDDDLECYLALVRPASPGWPQKQQRYAETLKMFGVRQPHAFLLAAHRHFTASSESSDFEQVLRACVVISMRYNVIGSLPPSEQERVYSDAAKAIAEGRVGSVSELLQTLRSIYPSDEEFCTAFAKKTIRAASRNSQVVRYILCELEAQETGTPLQSQGLLSLEHVFPQHPEDEWAAFPASETDIWSHRLGNMLLLENKKNRDLGNVSFKQKCATYRKSAVPSTKKLGEEQTQWTPKDIENRQRHMAKVATSLWRIGPLSGQ